MKKCITYTAVWDYKKNPDSFLLPKGCLSYTVCNKGNTKVTLAETEDLDTGECYPVEHHVGYYHTGVIKIRKENEADKPKIHVRITKEEL